MTTYNFANHVSGDTFLGINMELKDALGDPISLVGASVALSTVRDSNILSTDNGDIEITDEAGGIFQIKEQIISWPAGTYTYKIRVTFASGRKRTYVSGTWIIL